MYLFCMVQLTPTYNSFLMLTQIMELKKEGKIKGKDDPESIDAELDADDDNDQRTAEEVAMAKLRSQRESMRNNPVADAYADKIKARLGGGKETDQQCGDFFGQHAGECACSHLL